MRSPQPPSVVQRDILGASPRGPWRDVPDAQWNDWRWQQRERVRTLDALEAVVHLTEPERSAFAAASDRFRVAVTPYYAALMDPHDPSCPIRRQAIPQPEELQASPWDLPDPLGEEAHMPVPGLTHRYPDRVLLYVTHNCPVYCRHCTRKRKVADPGSAEPHTRLGAWVDYLVAHPEVKDVLVSGGDPLTLSDARLDALLEAVRRVPSVEVLRLCTRNPVTLPFRFTPGLIGRLRRHQPLLVHTHFNHPRECTPEAARCLRALADAGMSTANQMVLLRGVNDDPDVILETNRWLLRQRCRPYYLFQADLAEGISHFRTPVARGLEIVEALQGHVSGPAVPQLVVDAPGGGGKVRLQPDAVVERSEDRLVIRTYTGALYEYPLR